MTDRKDSTPDSKQDDDGGSNDAAATSGEEGQTQQEQRPPPIAAAGDNDGDGESGDAIKIDNDGAAGAATTGEVARIPDTREGYTPLHGRWTLWFDNPRLAPPGADWKENLKPCGTFQTVEEFWQIYNNLKQPTAIGANSNYSLFRHGIEPSWEDPQNQDGGKFVLNIPKKESRGGKCDEYWLFTVLALVGETLDASADYVNGAVVSIRKSQDRIALWLKGSDPLLCTTIGMRWKKAMDLQYSRKTVIRYQTHKDAAASGRSFQNAVQFEV